MGVRRKVSGGGDGKSGKNCGRKRGRMTYLSTCHTSDITSSIGRRTRRLELSVAMQKMEGEERKNPERRK